MFFKGKALKKNINKNGYNSVHLSGGGKARHFLVHRLVICMFKRKPFDWPYDVHFYDKNKLNDALSNLVFDRKMSEQRRPDNSKKTSGKFIKTYEVSQ